MRKALCSRSILFSCILLTLLMFAAPAVSSAAIVFSIGIAPPVLPVYAQPVCPGEGYIWEPGYWAYNDGYFWVPGEWVLIPEAGLFWTPGYWGWNGSLYVFNQGYWGPNVGFYGGINYGFGYTGVGYQGGYWNHGAFFYNRSVNNVGRLSNVYTKTVTVRNASHVSFNGPRGITARPTAAEQAAAHDRHIPPTGVQTAHVQAASKNRQSYASVNHGKPPVAATKTAQSSGRSAVAGKAVASSHKPQTTGHADRIATSRTEPRSSTPNHAAIPSSSHTAHAATPHATNPKPQRQASARPQPKPHSQPKQVESHPHQASVRPPAQPMAQSKPEPKPQARETHTEPRMAQQRPNSVNKPAAEQHHLPQAQQRVAHAAPRPQMQPKPAPAAKPAPPAHEKKPS
jgi:hypothetical protein